MGDRSRAEPSRDHRFARSGRHREASAETLRLPTVAASRCRSSRTWRATSRSSRAVTTSVRAGGAGCPDLGVGRGVGVGLGVERDAEEPESRRRASADLGRVLAHAAGEDERVEAAERGGHRRDAGPQAVDVDVDRQPGVVVVAREDGAHVGVAGQAADAALAIERPARGRRRRARGAAATAAARDRRCPTRVAMTRPSIGVKPMVVSTQTPSRTAASDAPGAEMAAHDARRRGAPRGVGVRQAVEAEAPQPEALAPLPRQGVGRGRRRQRRVKRRVEAGDGGHVGQGPADGGDAGQRRGLVQRGEVGELAQRRHDVVVDDARPRGSARRRARRGGRRRRARAARRAPRRAPRRRPAAGRARPRARRRGRAGAA